MLALAHGVCLLCMAVLCCFQMTPLTTLGSCWLICLPFGCGAFPYKTELQLGAEEVARVDV